MLIALDYDGTFEREPQMWVEFIRSARHFNHQVIIVTGRRNTHVCLNVPGDISVVYTHGFAYKVDGLVQAGYPRPDVWIDDMPGLIEPTRVLDFSS